MSQSLNHAAVPAERGQCQTIDLINKIAQIEASIGTRQLTISFCPNPEVRAPPAALKIAAFR